MNNIEFLAFAKTPNEKHLGIATIRYDRKFVFRYKIMINPKGEGYFLNAPSLKIDENYYPAFQFDSAYESDEIKKFVLENVKKSIQTEQPEQLNPMTNMPFESNVKTEEQVEFNFSKPPF